MRNVLLLFKSYIKPLFRILEILWIAKAQSSVDKQNPLKNSNSIDSRWVLDTTVKSGKFLVGKKVLGEFKDG